MGDDETSASLSSRISQMSPTDWGPVAAQVFVPTFVTVTVTRVRESMSAATGVRGTEYRALAGGSRTALYTIEPMLAMNASASSA